MLPNFIAFRCAVAVGVYQMIMVQEIKAMKRNVKKVKKNVARVFDLLAFR